MFLPTLAGCHADPVVVERDAPPPVEAPPPPPPELDFLCWDGLDDDGDGAIDCDDDGCADNVACVNVFPACEDAPPDFDPRDIELGPNGRFTTVTTYCSPTWSETESIGQCWDGANAWEDELSEFVLDALIDDYGAIVGQACDVSANTTCGPMSPAQVAAVTGDPERFQCCWQMELTIDCSLF